MRIATLMIFLFACLSVSAQRDFIDGQILDVKKQAVPGAHVSNRSSGNVVVSDIDGNFMIPAQLGDTLLLTSVGFRSLMVQVDANWPKEKLILVMQEGSIELSQVTVFSVPPIEQFKEQIIETQVKDSATFWYFGVEKPVFKGDKMLDGQIQKKLLYAILQPTSFIHYNVSKAEKEKRKYHQIEKNKHVVEKSQLKFTREWVSEHTGYTDEELTSFLAFCKYSPSYIAKTPLYMIMEDMMKKKEEFEKNDDG